MKKEKLLVRIISALLSFIMFLAFIVCVNTLNISNFMLDSHNVVDSADTKGLVKDMKKEVFDEQIHPYTQDYKELEDLYNDAINQEFIDYYMESMINAAVFGEDTYDPDEMRDLLHESTDDFVDDHEEIPKEKYDEVIDTIVDSAEMTVDEAVEISDNSEVSTQLNNVRDMVDMITIISFILIAVLAGVLFLIYRNKARPIVSVGRAAAFAMFFSAVGMILIKLIIDAVLEDADIDQQFLVTFIEKFVGSVFTKSILVVGFVFVVGIGLVIIGTLLSKLGRSRDDDDDYAYED